jgi:SAM-dependent methyltransferase/Tfp pilus assembly protein PilF
MSRPDFERGPDFVRGMALAQAGALDAAAAAFAEAARQNPTHAEAHNNLGIVLSQLGRFAEAADAFKAVTRLRPELGEIHGSLGNALAAIDRLDEALAAFDAAIARNPRLAQAHANRGAILRKTGRLDEARAAFQAALALAPNMLEAWIGLGYAALEQGQGDAALAHALTALRLNETPSVKFLFCQALIAVPVATVPDGLFVYAARALAEAWSRPSELAPAILRLSKSRPTGELLHTLLCNAIFSDADFEAHLTARRRLYLLGGEEPVEFVAALAQHCFNNEFVFAVGDDELAALDTLRKRLGPTPNARDLLAAACYGALAEFAQAEDWLALAWPAPLRDMLRVHIEEPLAERKIARTIMQRRPIAGETSQLVQAQYEENPYPRWARLGGAKSTLSAAQTLRARFPGTALQMPNPAVPDILIAGCGTGQHACERALEYPSARILAIDLSLASLAYAKRKAQELALENLEFAQADIVDLGDFEQRFDIVESVGVLHHLAEPERGFAVLAKLLRQGGLFRIGLYSEKARATVVAVRAFIAERGFSTSAADIQKCRQELRALPAGDPRTLALATFDFGSTGGCRDLFFHAQEHRHTLPEIAGWLARHGFAFLGFDTDVAVARAFAAAFPDPAAKTDLACWDTFERRHPLVFSGMYQFWAQKT